MMQTINCINTVRLFSSIPIVNVLFPIVNQSTVYDIGVDCHISAKTNNPDKMLLPIIAIKENMPEVDFFPRIA